MKDMKKIVIEFKKGLKIFVLLGFLLMIIALLISTKNNIDYYKQFSDLGFDLIDSKIIGNYLIFSSGIIISIALSIRIIIETAKIIFTNIEKYVNNK